MNFSTDEQRKESLTLLTEAADFLRRMPRAPVTSEFIARIEKHLDNPTARLTLQFKAARKGTVYAPGGVAL